MNRALLVVLVPFLAALIASVPAYGFEVVPTVSVIDLPRDSGGITLEVRNPGKKALPIQMEMYERTVEENGNEKRTPADNLFLVFPPQTVIAPHTSQAIRVQWLGAPPHKSRSFTLYAAQIPVRLSGKAKSGVRTIYRMGASIHVVASGERPRPVILASKQVSHGVRVTVGNRGTRYFYIDGLTLDFAHKKVGGTVLANMARRTLVPPGARRTFVVKNVTGKPRLEAPQ